CTVITAERPIFRWTPLGGATSYRVSVYDASLTLVRTSGPITATSWRIPERLNRGTGYTWMVTALKNCKEVFAPALPARAEFRVIEASERMRLNCRLDNTVSHAARGVLYARAGLLDNAEREFQAHLRIRQHDKQAARLFSTVKSWRI